MMDTAPALYTWHDDVDIDGRPYPTRNPVPDNGTCSDDYLGDLTNGQRDHLRATHEAAHAVSCLAAGGHVHYARIATTTVLKSTSHSQSGFKQSGNVMICNLTEGSDVAAFLGAGERAEDRWLHQNNLWTPTRAVGIEFGAFSDRHHFLDLNPHFGFGVDHNDYRVVHDLADDLITRHWDAITAVSHILATRLHLTGGDIADLARLPNGVHSRTCNYTA